MPGQHKPVEFDISSFLLKRRAVLTGTAAATISISAPALAAYAEPADNYDEIIFDADQVDEIRPLHIDAILLLDKIERQPDCPAMHPIVDLLSIVGEDHLDQYYRSCGNPVWVGKEGIEHMRRFFSAQLEMAHNRAKCKPEWADWPKVKADDWRKADACLREQIEARRRWEMESGFLTAEAEVDRLLDALIEAERMVFCLPCLSFRDVCAKLDVVERWELDREDMLKILGSIRHFTNSNSRPAAASG